jgi:hypothetical protein
MEKEKNKASPVASHLRKYWSIELALIVLVIGWLALEGSTTERDYTQVYMPVFLGIEIFRQMLGLFVCGSSCLIPFAFLDTEVSNVKILGLRVLAIIVFVFLVWLHLFYAFETTDEFFM